MRQFFGFILILIAMMENVSAQSLPSHTATVTKFPNGAVITNYETKGNLESKNDLKCIKLTEVKNTYTPADLYKAFAQCIQDNKYEDAIPLFMVAGAYGKFDSRRVADVSSHQAMTVLIMNNTASLTDEQKKKWKESLGTFTAGNSSPEFLQACNSIKHLGPPDYYPSYMIQHGMGAFTKSNGNPIVDNFNPQSAWEEAQEKYLHCPLD